MNNIVDYVIKIIITAIALVVSIVLHELAHGYVALLNGDRTAKNAGRLSINPAKHFDLMGILMLLVINVGYAKPVPINPNNFRKRRFGFFTVSIAGITVNLFLSFIFTAFYLLMQNFAPSNLILQYITLLFYCMSFYNLFLCFFNLLPLYPLDGYNLLESILGFRNTTVRFLRNYGTMMLMALFLLGMIVRWMTFPEWLDLLSLYLHYTSNVIYSIFTSFWKLIFRLY